MHAIFGYHTCFIHELFEVTETSVFRIHILLLLDSKMKIIICVKKSEIISRDHRLPTSPIYMIVWKQARDMFSEENCVF
jgi:hypothetical protein